MKGASSRGRGPCRCRLDPPNHAITESGFRDRGLVLLRQVELTMLLKQRTSVLLAQGTELGPLLGELLGETALRRNGLGRVG
jgi:hypothetical protein